jgi:hypothetical protein
LSAHAQRSYNSSHILKRYKLGSTHTGQAFVNLVHCNHKFATTHLCDETEVSDAEINWKSKKQQSRRLEVVVKLPAIMPEQSFIADERLKSPSPF